MYMAKWSILVLLNKVTILRYYISQLRIDYGDDGAIHALVHLNLNSSALVYPN